MSDSEHSSRRRFIKSALGAGVTLAVAPQLACVQPGRRQPETKPGGEAPAAGGAAAGGAQTTTQPSTAPSKYRDLRIAYVGTGGIGGYHLHETVPLGVSCLCYCDVDKSHHAKAAEAFPKARAYQDYREMFDKEHKNIDAVMIGTPDHHHYPATMIAMQLGKHVYTQKPLTHTPWEARQLAIAAKKYKVATQMGNQGHGMEGWRLVYEWVHAGAIGDIKETHTWTDRPIWPQGYDRPEGEDPVPSNLNWDCWLGPAAQRPFKAKWTNQGEETAVYHPFVWRGWYDFGAGALGDMACHTMDAIFATFDPGSPSAVEVLAATPIYREDVPKPTLKEMYPKSSIIRWHWPAQGRRKAFTSYWYDGGLIPPAPPELERDRRMPQTGNLFIGTKGTMLIQGDYCEHPRIIPEAKMKEFGKPKRLLERSPGHILEWIMAAAGEKPIDYPKSNFSYAGPFAEAILLGNIALRFGRRLEWDGRKMQFTNVPEANQYVTKEYRSGWKF